MTNVNIEEYFYFNYIFCYILMKENQQNLLHFQKIWNLFLYYLQQGSVYHYIEAALVRLLETRATEEYIAKYSVKPASKIFFLYFGNIKL